MCKRIQRKRTKGWRKPANTVNVCRPGKWGNPWRIGDDDVPDAQAAVDYYYRWIMFSRPKHLDLSELRGKDLMCFCKLGQPCHGDILLELANT